MGDGSSERIFRDLETLFQAGVTGGLTDGQLLDRFIAGGAAAEAAFEAIVRRHGAMVLGVCRRALDDAHSAEDAFQATFLVLVVRAGAIRRRESLGPWLHGVASRLSRRARLLNLRQAASRPLPAVAAREPAGDAADIGPVLDEELGRLPEKYRRPVVLCYLEGQTQDEAARALGWTKGTVSGRLARAKDLLRGRLARRGLAPSAGLLALATGTEAAAAVPASLAGATARAAVALALGQGETAAISGPVLALVRGARRAMLLGWLKAAASVALLLGALASAVAIGQADPRDRRPVPTKVPGEVVAAARRLVGPILPRGARAQMGTAHLRHGANVVQAVFSPDGRTLATAGLDGAVRFWDLQNGAPAQGVDVLDGPRSPLALAYSPDGRLVAVGRDDGTVQLWDVLANRERFRSQAHRGQVQGLAFAPDGLTFASVSIADACVRLWDIATRKEVRTLAVGEDAYLGSLALSPDGSRLALASSSRRGDGETVRIWNIREGGNAVIIRKAHDRSLAGLAFNDRGTELITGGVRIEPSKDEKGDTQESEHPQIRFWRVRDGRKVRELAPEGVTGQGGLVLAQDETTLVTSHRERLLVWDLVSGRVIRSIAVAPQRDAPQFGVIALSPDGQTLAALRGDQKVHLLDFATGHPVFPEGEGHQGAVFSVAFAPDGHRLVTTGADGTVRLWDPASGAHRARFDLGAHGSALSACIALDGTVLAAAGEYRVPGAQGFGIVRMWDLPGGRLRHELRFNHRATHVAFAPDGRHLAVAVWSNAPGGRGLLENWVYVFDSRAGTRVGELPRFHSFDWINKIQAIAFAPDGTTLAAASADMTVRFWNPATGEARKELLDLEPASIDAARRVGLTRTVFAVFAPDLTRVVTSVRRDDRLIVWDLTTGREALTIHVARSLGSILAVSPDGRLLASYSTMPAGPGGGDTAIRLWDMATGQPVLRLDTGGRGVRALSFAPDGRSLASAMNDATALIWDVKAAYDQLRR